MSEELYHGRSATLEFAVRDSGPTYGVVTRSPLSAIALEYNGHHHLKLVQSLLLKPLSLLAPHHKTTGQDRPYRDDLPVLHAVEGRL